MNKNCFFDRNGQPIREGSVLINPKGWARWVVYYCPHKNEWRAFSTCPAIDKEVKLIEIAHLFLLENSK